jgi:hydroxyacylglutathione hydrolase
VEPVYIFCGSGLRSTVAASILEQRGITDLTVVLGGVAAWQAAAQPVT